MNTIYKKDKYQQQEDLLKELKQRLEDCWSGASQVIEELEEFYYDIQIDKRLNERTRESLEQFFDYQLADIKEKAMDIQDETQNSIDNFVEQFNLNEEV
jgi:alcohol dehydrogenase class IV|tara:strand:- start:183 stop:479 length:297 start_codon:yes stop_codon:yes gene_type:complete